MKFLIFGDVVGEPGREAIKRALPILKEEYDPEVVIVNVENIAHGKGISIAAMEEIHQWGVDVYTTGDHAWDNAQGIPLLDNPKWPIIRPANYPAGVPGRGYQIIQKGAWEVAVINLQGQVFFKNDPLNPFIYLDEILQKEDVKRCQIKLLDFHVEASSEARAMGWYADGRLSAVWGTHTHVPAADAQILPQGCGYVTSVGMNGSYLSVIGIDRSIIRGFLTQIKQKPTIEEKGPLEVGALFLDVDPATGRATKLEIVRKILNAE